MPDLKWEFWWGVFPRSWMLGLNWGVMERRVSVGPLHLTWSKREKPWNTRRIRDPR